MKKLAIFASGSGSNALNIHEYFKEINGKKLGFFALLDKNSEGKLAGTPEIHADFNQCFHINSDGEGFWPNEKI